MLSGPAKSGFFNPRRGTQVVRERSAKPLCVGSIPTRASINPVAALQNRSSIVFEISAWMLLMQRARRVFCGAPKQRKAETIKDAANAGYRA
jgi:hypothetical protein